MFNIKDELDKLTLNFIEFRDNFSKLINPEKENLTKEFIDRFIQNNGIELFKDLYLKKYLGMAYVFDWRKVASFGPVGKTITDAFKRICVITGITNEQVIFCVLNDSSIANVGLYYDEFFQCVEEEAMITDINLIAQLRTQTVISKDFKDITSI